MATLNITDVNPSNVIEETLFCSKDIKSVGFKAKQDWLEKRHQEGLRIKLIKNNEGKPIAFIEYIPAEYAWRPIKAEGYMFVHCMFVYRKNDRENGVGSELLKVCEQEAKSEGMKGLVAMTSNGSWIANKGLFLKNGFTEVDKRGRFELVVKNFSGSTPSVELIDWTKEQAKYQGWNLIYADQCPWHQKAFDVLQKVAKEHGLDLKITKLHTAKDAQKAPSGFGVFSLIKDGRLLEDHYISETRFKNILKKELKL